MSAATPTGSTVAARTATIPAARTIAATSSPSWRETNISAAPASTHASTSPTATAAASANCRRTLAEPPTAGGERVRGEQARCADGGDQRGGERARRRSVVYANDARGERRDDDEDDERPGHGLKR